MAFSVKIHLSVIKHLNRYSKYIYQEVTDFDVKRTGFYIQHQVISKYSYDCVMISLSLSDWLRAPSF